MRFDRFQSTGTGEDGKPWCEARMLPSSAQPGNRGKPAVRSQPVRQTKINFLPEPPSQDITLTEAEASLVDTGQFTFKLLPRLCLGERCYKLGQSIQIVYSFSCLPARKPNKRKIVWI